MCASLRCFSPALMFVLSIRPASAVTPLAEMALLTSQPGLHHDEIARTNTDVSIVMQQMQQNTIGAHLFSVDGCLLAEGTPVEGSASATAIANNVGNWACLITLSRCACS